MKEGWMCPRCETIYAPWMPSCNCKSGGVKLTHGLTNEELVNITKPIPDEELARLRAEYDANVEI